MSKFEEIASRALQGLLSNSHEDVIALENGLIVESAVELAHI